MNVNLLFRTTETISEKSEMVGVEILFFEVQRPVTIYSALRKYSKPLTYSTFCCVTAKTLNVLNIFSPIYTQ
jgi:hypothetical protein